MKFSIVFILVIIVFYNAACLAKKGSSRSSSRSKSRSSGRSNSGVPAKPASKGRATITTTENSVIKSRTTDGVTTQKTQTTLPSAVTLSSYTEAIAEAQRQEYVSEIRDCLDLQDDAKLSLILNNLEILSWYMDNCYPYRVDDLIVLI